MGSGRPQNQSSSVVFSLLRNTDFNEVATPSGSYLRTIEKKKMQLLMKVKQSNYQNQKSELKNINLENPKYFDTRTETRK